MPVKKTSNRYAPLVAIIILVIALAIVKQCSPKKNDTKTRTETTANSRGFNRNPSAINYSKHARCRMDCRKITESEVQAILKSGTINYSKSELGNLPDCKKKYALEGNTNDGQRVRMIFAPCQTEVTVVTVIDLGQEWPCACH